MDVGPASRNAALLAKFEVAMNTPEEDGGYDLRAAFADELCAAFPSLHARTVRSTLDGNVCFPAAWVSSAVPLLERLGVIEAPKPTPKRRRRYPARSRPAPGRA